MSTLRSLRLLGAVEAGTVNSTQLQGFLSDAGRASEFSVLLGNRGQSRRMANSPLTMSTIVGSAAATDIIFKAATPATAFAAQAVVLSPIAMNVVANNKASLYIVGSNNISWNLFTASSFYETNVRTIIANYASLNSANYPTVDLLISDPMSMADISAAPFAMSAVVASAPSTTLMAANSSAMSLVASNLVAINIVAAQTSIMSIIANSPNAMTEIVSRSGATAKMASYPGSISAISKVPTAWASYLAGPFFGTNIALVLSNLIGVSPGNYPTLNSIIADASALALVSKNAQAVQALASNNAAMSNLATSPNIGVILGSSTAMAVVGTNTSAMTSFLNASGAWDGLFASSVAKGYIMASNALIDAIASNTSLISYLKGKSVTASATGVPDGNATSMQPFTGLPSKVLVLAAKEVGIAATYSNYNFGGAAMSGSQAGATLSLSGTGPGGQPAHVAGYTAMTWNFQGVGVTAATLPIITYFDMS